MLTESFTLGLGQSFYEPSTTQIVPPIPRSIEISKHVKRLYHLEYRLNLRTKWGSLSRNLNRNFNILYAQKLFKLNRNFNLLLSQIVRKKFDRWHNRLLWIRFSKKLKSFSLQNLYSVFQEQLKDEYKEEYIYRWNKLQLKILRENRIDHLFDEYDTFYQSKLLSTYFQSWIEKYQRKMEYKEELRDQWIFLTNGLLHKEKHEFLIDNYYQFKYRQKWYKLYHLQRMEIINDSYQTYILQMKWKRLSDDYYKMKYYGSMEKSSRRIFFRKKWLKWYQTITKSTRIQILDNAYQSFNRRQYLYLMIVDYIHKGKRDHLKEEYHKYVSNNETKMDKALLRTTFLQWQDYIYSQKITRNFMRTAFKNSLKEYQLSISDHSARTIQKYFRIFLEKRNRGKKMLYQYFVKWKRIPRKISHNIIDFPEMAINLKIPIDFSAQECADLRINKQIFDVMPIVYRYNYKARETRISKIIHKTTNHFKLHLPKPELSTSIHNTLNVKPIYKDIESAITISNMAIADNIKPRINLEIPVNDIFHKNWESRIGKSDIHISYSDEIPPEFIDRVSKSSILELSDALEYHHVNDVFQINQFVKLNHQLPKAGISIFYEKDIYLSSEFAADSILSSIFTLKTLRDIISIPIIFSRPSFDIYKLDRIKNIHKDIEINDFDFMLADKLIFIDTFSKIINLENRIPFDKSDYSKLRNRIHLEVPTVHKFNIKYLQQMKRKQIRIYSGNVPRLVASVMHSTHNKYLNFSDKYFNISQIVRYSSIPFLPENKETMTSLIKPNKISNQLDHTYASLKPILKTDKLYQMHFIELPKQSFHHHDDLFDINLTLSQLDLPKSTLSPRPKISYLHNQEIDSVSHEIQSSLNLEQIYFQQPSLQLNGNYGSYRNIISNQFIDIVWNTNANIDISSSHRKVVLLTKLLCSYQSPNSVNNIALQEDTKVRNDMHISEVPKIKLLIQIENHKAQKLTSLFNFCIKKKFCGFHANHSEENGRQSSSISSYPIDDKSLLKLSPKLSMNNVLLYNVLPQQLLFSMNHLDSKFISFHHSESLDFNKFTTLSFDNTLSCISYQHNNIKYINFLRNLHMKSSKFQPAALSQDENLINIQHRKELNIPEFRYLCHKAEKLNEFVFIEKFKKSTTKDHNINELDINEIMKKLPLNCLQQIFNSFYNISHHHQYPKELVYNDPNLDLSAFGYIQKNKLPEIHDNNHTQHQSNDKANEIKITIYFDYLSYPPIRRILSKMISIRASTPKLKEKMNIPFINTCIIPSFNIVEKRLSLINNYSGQKKNQYRKQHKENINIDDYIISLTTQNISYKLHFLNIMNPRNDRQKDNHSSASPLVKNEIMFNNIPQIPKLDNTIHKLGCINEFNHHLKHIQHIHENNQNNEENLLTALIFTKFEEITKFYIDRIFYINDFGNTFHNIFTDLSENEEINLNNLNLTKICQTKFVYNCLGTIPKRYHNLCIFDKNYRKEIPRMKKKDLSFGTYACENGLLGFTLNFSYIQFNKLIKPLISYSNKVLHIDDNEVINEDYNLDGMKLPIELEVNKSVVSIIKFNKLTKLYAKQLLPQSIKIEKDTGELDSDSLPSVELIKCQYLVPNRKTILNNYTQSIPQNISNAIAVHDIDDVIPRFHCQVNISEMKSNKFDRYRYLKNFAPSTNQISNRTKAYSCKDRDQQNEYLPYFSFDDLLPMKNLTVLPIKLYSKSNKSPIKSREFSGNQIDEYKIQNQLKWNITSISTTRVKIAKLQNLKPKNNTYKINDYIDLNKEYDEECDYILVHSTLSISNSFHNDNNIKLNKLFAFLPNKDKSKCNTINDNFTIYKTFNSAFSFLPKVNLSFLEELNIIYHRAKTIKSKEPNKLDINSSQLLDNFLKKEIPHLINHLNLSPCTSIKTNKFIFSSEKLPSAKLRNISYLLPNKQKSLLLYTSTDSIKSQKDIEDLQQKFMCNLSYDIFFQPKTVSSIEFYYPIHQNRLHEINNENVILCVDVNEPSIYIPKNNKMKALYTFQSSNFHEEERSKDTIDTIYHYGNIYETKTHLFDDNVSINNQHVSINNINFQINNRFDSLNNINKFTKSIFLNKITNESENDLNLTPLPNLNYSFALHNKERPLLDSFFLPVILSPTSVDEQSTFTNLDSTIDELMSTKKAFLIPRYVNNIDYLNNYHFWNDSLEILKDINQSDFAELKHTIFIDKAIFNKVTKILILLRNYYYEKQSVNINGYHQISKQENQSNSFNENDLMPMFEFIDIHDNLSKGLEYVNVYNTTNKTNQVAIDALLKPKENLNVSKIVYSKIVKTKFISNFHATPSTFKSHISSPNDLTFCFNLNFDIFFSNNKFNIPNPITLDHRIDISSFHFPTKAPEIIVMKKFHQIQKLVSFNKPGIKFVNETLSKIDLIHTTSSFSDNWHLSIQKYQLVDLNSYLSKRLPHFGFSHKTNEAGKDKIDSIIFNPKITFSDSIVVSNQINQTKYISNFQYNDSIITPKENISNSTHEMFCFDLNFDLILSTFKIRIPDSIELNHEINANDFLFTPKPPQINFVKKSNKMNNLISFTKTETKLNKEIYDEEALSRIQFFDETSLIPDITSEYRVEVKMNSLFYLMNVRRHKMPELYDKDRINSEVLAQIDDSLFGFIKIAITTKNFTTSSDEGPNYIFTSSEPEMPIRSPRSRRRPFNPTDKVNNQQFVKVIDLLKNKTQSSTDASDASLFDNSSEGSQSPRSKKKQSPAFNIHRRNSSHSLQSDSVPFDEEEDGFY